jgi:selenocysteine-specific translation elongation factor
VRSRKEVNDFIRVTKDYDVASQSQTDARADTTQKEPVKLVYALAETSQAIQPTQGNDKQIFNALLPSVVQD